MWAQLAIMGTFVAILAGTIAGPLLMGIEASWPVWVSATALLVAVVGYLTSRRIPEAPAVAPDLRINWNFLAETIRNIRFIGENRIVLNLTIDQNAVSGGELTDNLPVEFALENPYPNPFNSLMRINYTVPRREHVRIVVFDLLGREVAQLVGGSVEPGRYSAVFNGENMASGIYFVRLESTDYTRTVKAVLLK